MSNFNRPQGFRPYGEVRQAVICVAGSTIYRGDFVALASTGKVNAVAAATPIYGLCLQNGVVDDRVLISVHSDQLYAAQTHGSSLTAQTSIGNCADILATSADTTYKISRMEIDDSSLATSAKQLLIVDILQKPSNAGGANVECVVKINQHQAFGKDSFAGV